MRLILLTGEVDHGKSTMYSRLVGIQGISEYGDITQTSRIGQILGTDTYVIDTPGHELFEDEVSRIGRNIDKTIYVIDPNQVFTDRLINRLSVSKPGELIIVLTKVLSRTPLSSGDSREISFSGYLSTLSRDEREYVKRAIEEAVSMISGMHDVAYYGQGDGIPLFFIDTPRGIGYPELRAYLQTIPIRDKTDFKIWTEIGNNYNEIWYTLGDLSGGLWVKKLYTGGGQISRITYNKEVLFNNFTDILLGSDPNFRESIEGGSHWIGADSVEGLNSMIKILSNLGEGLGGIYTGDTVEFRKYVSTKPGLRLYYLSPGRERKGPWHVVRTIYEFKELVINLIEEEKLEFLRMSEAEVKLTEVHPLSNYLFRSKEPLIIGVEVRGKLSVNDKLQIGPQQYWVKSILVDDVEVQSVEDGRACISIPKFKAKIQNYLGIPWIKIK